MSDKLFKPWPGGIPLGDSVQTVIDHANRNRTENLQTLAEIDTKFGELNELMSKIHTNTHNTHNISIAKQRLFESRMWLGTIIKENKGVTIQE